MELRECLRSDMREYQSIPFWSWNDKLEPEKLRQQIRDMKAAGIGGFFMHARGGLLTEYMGEEWFQAVEASIDEARKQNMDAWCYDENGWPSGFAGMKLLEDKNNWEHYITYKEIDWFDPEAMACYKLRGGNLIRVYEGAADCAVYDHQNSSVVDILNPEIVRKFLDETHEKYYERFKDAFGKTMAGFFTDEPQYFRWDTAYSPCVLPLYKSRYGEDLMDVLGALFADCNQSDRTRYRYWLLMNELYTENFAGQIYRWCEAHNCQLTGHAIEERNLFWQMICCAGIMPFYEYEQKPGMDWLGRGIDTEIAPRQVSSVAQQLGKKHVMTETFACAGWDVTPRELKRIAEWQYVNGVNQMCQHLYPYSIRGQRKRDYPAFYSEHNPWTTQFKHFNDYFTALGYMLSESREEADVAVIHPIHSAYFTYKRNEAHSVDELDASFAALVEKLGAANIGHHYVDEYLLAKHGTAMNGKLIMGQCAYSKVVVPDMKGIDGTTLRTLRKFVAQGGKLYLAGQCPTHVDGEEARVGLVSNIGFEDLKNTACYIDNENTEIRSTLRRAAFGDFIYAVNLSETETYEVAYTAKAPGARKFDLEERNYAPVYYEKTEDGVKIPLCLKPGDSVVIMLDEGEAGEKVCLKDAAVTTGLTGKIVAADKNTLTLDYAALSYDGVEYTDMLPIMAVSDRLLRGKTDQKVYLKFRFTVAEKVADLRLEAEKMNAVAVYLNGEKLELDGPGSLDTPFASADVAGKVNVGENEVVFEIDYYQPKQVYDVFNGVYYEHSDGTESLINCLSYVTDIEAIYLRGDFGVKCGAYTPDKKNTLTTTAPFAIVPSVKDVALDKLTEAGYPFFGGAMTFDIQLDAAGDEKQLTLGGRFAVAKISINGSDEKMLMMYDNCDVTGLFKAGRNDVRVTIISSYRNVFGPFHDRDTDPFGVGPDTFARYGSWEDGKSRRYVDRYSFVHFGVDSITLR